MKTKGPRLLLGAALLVAVAAGVILDADWINARAFVVREPAPKGTPRAYFCTQPGVMPFNFSLKDKRKGSGECVALNRLYGSGGRPAGS